MKAALARLALSLLLFVLALRFLPLGAPLFAALFPGVARPVFEADDLPSLAFEHALLVAAATLLATLAGLAGGIAASRDRDGGGVRPVLDALFSLAQAVPPVAVVALALPLTGFGPVPTLIALVLYGALPVMRATTGALGALPGEVIEAARGQGMTPLQSLLRVELPLAAAVIMSGVRTSAVLGVATAAVGAVAGSRGLGLPIIVGLANGNPAYVLQGALFVAWLALIVDSALALAGRALTPGADEP